MDVTCPYSEHKKHGLRQYKICTLTHEGCPFIRMCGQRNLVIHTEKALGCELRLKESGEIK